MNFNKKVIFFKASKVEDQASKDIHETLQEHTDIIFELSQKSSLNDGEYKILNESLKIRDNIVTRVSEHLIPENQSWDNLWETLLVEGDDLYLELDGDVYNVGALFKKIDAGGFLEKILDLKGIKDLDEYCDAEGFPDRVSEESDLFLSLLASLEDPNHLAEMKRLISEQYNIHPRKGMMALHANVDIDPSFNLEKNRRNESGSIEAYIEGHKNLEVIQDLIKRWGYTEDLSDIDYKKLRTKIGSFMEGKEPLFPKEWDIVLKNRVGQEFVDVEYGSFKILLLTPKIEKNIKFSNIIARGSSKLDVVSLMAEIEHLNDLVSDDKNIIDWFYAKNFTESDHEYRQNKPDLVKLYTIFGSNIEGGLNLTSSKEELNRQIVDSITQDPGLFWKAVGSTQMKEMLEDHEAKKKGGAEVFQEFMNAPLFEQINLAKPEKRKIANLLKQDASVLGVMEGLGMDGVRWKQEMEDAGSDEDKIFQIVDRMAATKKQKDLQEVDFKELSKNQQRFSSVYNEYTILNRVFEGSVSNNARSFFRDLQDGMEERSDKGKILNAFSFITRSFPDILANSEAESIYAEMASLGEGDSLGVYESKLVKYEAEIYEKYDARRRGDRFVSMVNTFFFDNQDLYMDMAKKDTEHLSDHYSKLPEEREGFVKFIISQVNEDDSIFEKLGIEDKNNIKRIKDTIKEFGGSNKMNTLDEIFNLVMSCKAEGEIVPIMKGLQNADENGMSQEQRYEKLSSLIPKYKILRGRTEKSAANIVEDYFRSASEGSRESKIKAFLHSTNMVKDVDGFVQQNPDLKSSDNGYNEDFTDIVDRYLEEDPKNEKKFLKFLSDQKIEKLETSKKAESSTLTYSELTMSLANRFETSQKDQIDINNRVAEDYNVSGYSLITQGNFLFGLGYEQTLEEYRSGAFEGNGELNELIGLRLLAQWPEQGGSLNTRGIFDIEFPLEDMDELDRFYYHYIEASSSEEKEGLLDDYIKNSSKGRAEIQKYIRGLVSKGEVSAAEVDLEDDTTLKRFYKKLVFNVGHNEMYFEIARNVYNRRRDDFFEKHESYIDKVSDQRRLAFKAYEKRREAEDNPNYRPATLKRLREEAEKFEKTYEENHEGLKEDRFTVGFDREFYDKLIESLTGDTLIIQVENGSEREEYKRKLQELFEGESVESEISEDEERMVVSLKESTKERVPMEELIERVKPKKKTKFSGIRR